MRERIPYSVIIILFAALAVSLFYRQVMRYPHYSELSRNNSIRIIPIDGPRGDIFDRNGKVLVTSRLSFDVAIVYNQIRDRKRLINVLSSVVGMSGDKIIKSLEKASSTPFEPVVIAQDIDKEKAILLEESSCDIDGFMIKTGSLRSYPYDKIGSHLFGYISEVSEEGLAELRPYGYRMRDMVGRDGLEKYYDAYLKGTDGGIQYEVDNRGRQTRMLGLKEPTSGKDLHLTVDINLQSVCDDLLGDRKGAIVVMNPKSGEVLALSSHPAYDPNFFVRPDASGERLRLIRDKSGRPLSNRAISGLYAPGSVFKIVTASAGLETGKINSSTCFFCSGSYKLGRREFKCWKKEGHGSQDIKAGLMNSCNVFFYNTARVLGVDSLESYAKVFGFGKLTGIDLPDEVKGIVPGRIWKRMHRKDNWYEGETLNYGIGQGYLLVTPIQILDMMAVMANGGKLVKPYIVKSVDSTDIAHPKLKNVGLKDETIRKVREGLFSVVNADNGTGKRAKLDGVAVAGKTGTAENPQGRTHAWFTGFAPYDDSAICLVVFLEHGGKGGLAPAEIANGIFKEAKRVGYL